TVPPPIEVDQIEIAGARAARPAEPGITWAVLDADSPEAIALRYGDTTERYALATEPASNGFTTRSLYENLDGEWVKIVDDVLPDGLRTATFSGDAIYAVGTAPATAGAAPGSAGRFDIAARTWSSIPLPDEVMSYTSDHVSASSDMSISPLSDGVLVAVNRYPAWVDYETVVASLDGIEPVGQPEWVDGALRVIVSCDEDPSQESGSTPIATDVLEGVDIEEFCDTRTLSANDLGLTEMDVAALESTPRSGIWRFDGSTLTSVDLPDPAAESSSISNGVLTTWSATGSRTWFITDDGGFVEALDGMVESDYGSFRSFDNQLAGGFGSYVVTDSIDGPTTAIDLRSVVIDDSMVNPHLNTYGAATANGATVSIVQVDYAAPGTIDTPTTITGSGYDLVIDPSNGVTVIDQSTGQQVTDGYRLVSTPGSIQLVASPGLSGSESPGTVPTTTIVSPATTVEETVGTVVDDGVVLDEFDIDPATLPMWGTQNRAVLASTIDGESYAVESLADLVGTTEGEFADTGQIEVIDGRFVARGSVYGNSDEIRSFVLVGTPTV
ncbi:MAG: hypothetical protein ABJ382_11635, partial [Ilumatobacter sp.]